jgi:hypothetical protein
VPVLHSELRPHARQPNRLSRAEVGAGVDDARHRLDSPVYGLTRAQARRVFEFVSAHYCDCDLPRHARIKCA